MHKYLIEVIEKPKNGEWGKEDLTGDGVPVIRTANFTDNGFINYSNIIKRNIASSKVESKALKYQDIVIEKSGGSDNKPVGRVVFFEKKDKDRYLFNNFTSLLRVKNHNEILPKYLFYFLFNFYWKNGTSRYENKTTGIHNLRLDEMLNNVEINIPDINTQNNIIVTLDQVNDLISLRSQQLEQFDLLIKSRFVEMFGDPVNGTAKWPLQIVGDVTNSVDPQPSHRTPPIDQNGIPYVSIKDIDYKSGKINFENARKVSKKILAEHNNRYKLKDGDFIIGKIGTIGKPFFVPSKIDYTLSANVVLIQPNNELVDPYFLKYSFESNFVERQFLVAQNSTSQAAFGIQKVRLIQIMNPNLKIQQNFADFVQQVDKAKASIKKSLEQLEILKKKLMQDYFG